MKCQVCQLKVTTKTFDQFGDALTWGRFEHVYAQELEVRSLNHPYSLKTKSSQCHYVVMTRSETKFQAPLNRRNQEVSDISPSQNNERLKIGKK